MMNSNNPHPGTAVIAPDTIDWMKKKLPNLGVITPLQSMVSSVTTEWKVRWTPDNVARDLMQNFRDAAKGRLRQVSVKTTAAGDVVVHGPEEFLIARLYYFGSEKSSAAGDLGGFGEGFKAAAVALLRDYGTTPIVVSGKDGVILSIAEQPIAGTDLHPIEYHFFRHNGSLRGTYLLLRGAEKSLLQAMNRSHDWFFDEQHPAITGAALVDNSRIAVYPTNRRDGLGFYCGHLRTYLPNVPFVVHCKNPEEKLEKLVSNDRDRRMFEGKAADRYLFNVTTDVETQGRATLLAALKPIWAKGHGNEFLMEIAARTRQEQIPDMKKIINADGERYFVARDDRHDVAYCEQDRLRFIAHQWKSEGLIELPGYFSRFGIKAASMQLESEREETRRANKQKEIEARNRQHQAALAENAAIERRRKAFEKQVADVWARQETDLQRAKGECLAYLVRLAIQTGFLDVKPDTVTVRVRVGVIEAHRKARLNEKSEVTMTKENGCLKLLVNEKSLPDRFSVIAPWFLKRVRAATASWERSSVLYRDGAEDLVEFAFANLGILTKLSRQWVMTYQLEEKEESSVSTPTDNHSNFTLALSV